MKKGPYPFSVPFEELPPDATLVAGGKGASLARMTALGLPVPPGFVVCAETFRVFLHQSGGAELIANLMHRLDVNEATGVERVSEEIRELITSIPLPAEIDRAIRESYGRLKHPNLLAVRSSAVCEDGRTASFAGQHDTFLNVKGVDAVLARVRECWASFFAPRALFYRERKGSLDDTRMAVVVQEMVPAEKSGVMFTVDPVQSRHDCMVIEAVLGPGEAIVSGTVTPDHYVIARGTGAIVHEFIPEEEGARVLSTDELNRLRELGLRLEQAFGSPQDVEWCIRGEDVLLLQSRPITTLNHA